MKTEFIVIENERELKVAQALVAKLDASRQPADVARLGAQALLLHGMRRGAARPRYRRSLISHPLRDGAARFQRHRPRWLRA